jgi:predicted DNA-binding transcriptional regulator AlpA
MKTASAKSAEISLAHNEQERLVRLPQVLKIIPISRSAWWAGVKAGRFPQPIKLGERLTCWRYSEVLALTK